VLTDGRPDFASNPFNGPLPSYEEAKKTVLDTVGTSPVAKGTPTAETGPILLGGSVGVPPDLGVLGRKGNWYSSDL
jgi:hypothetical protein